MYTTCTRAHTFFRYLLAPSASLCRLYLSLLRSQVIKAMRILDFLDDLETHLRLPPFLFRMVRVWGIVLYVVHAFTCIYWLTKLVSNKDEEMAVWYSQVRFLRSFPRLSLSPHPPFPVTFPDGFGMCSTSSGREAVTTMPRAGVARR